MRIVFFVGLAVFLWALRGAFAGPLEELRQRIRDWAEETHSAGFELRRHFLRRFFESELISDPAQAKVVAGGVLAVLISLSIAFTQAYYHKYLQLDGLPSAEPYRRASLADFLFIETLVMEIIALFTTLQWPSLFPGLRDYLALAALPVRMRDIFMAKFAALAAFASLTIVATASLPSIVLPAVMNGRYSEGLVLQIPAMFVSSSLAGLFVFFSLVTLQGVLLNILPVRQFSRISLAVQGLLLALILCSAPLAMSIPDLAPYMDLRPAWAALAPPIWFLGVDQRIAGNEDPMAARLALIGCASVACAAAAALLAYLWSYRRHRVRVIESPGTPHSSGAASRGFAADLEERLAPEPRTLAVFAFIGRSLARSRQHRLILTAFAAVALAVISEGFFSLFAGSGRLRVPVASPAFRQAVIAAPLALSLFTLAGLRYLFRLPVELRANWIFRMHEPGNALALLGGVETFLTTWGALPVALATLPFEMAFLGARAGLLAALMCLLASLALMELLLFEIERIPFTSSYFPGKDPPVVTLVQYIVASALYVGALSSLIRIALPSPAGTIILLTFLAASWLGARFGRLGSRQMARLEFEELADPAVQLLRIERD